MGLKVKLLPSRFKVPSCTQQPKTSSFRLTATMKDDIFKTINSVYLDHESDSVETPDSWFTHSSELHSSGSASDEYEESSMSISGDTHLEDIVRGAQQSSSANHRLLFDPTAQQDSPKLGPRVSKAITEGSHVRKLTSIRNTKQTRSINNNNNNNVGYKESVAMCMESEDPYEDFKRSMEEMVESLKVKDDWEELEELLGWYLKVNGKKHHGFIISAFIDLLAQINIDGKNSYSSNSDDSSSDINSDCKNENVRSTTSFCSATSSLSSSCGNSTPDHL